MNKIWIVEGTAAHYIGYSDVMRSYHKSYDGAKAKKNELEANSKFDRYSFDILEVTLED